MILERLEVKIDANLSGLRDITAGAARMERNVDRSMSRAGQAASDFGVRVQDAGTKLTLGLTVPLAALGVATIITSAKFDQMERGLTSVTGSAGETERQLIRLRDVAKLPGLGFEEAVQGSINLQAAGFNADLAERALMGFGNALATVGRGREDLQGVIMALGQIASKGKISAEEINQLAERVPQIRQVMIAAFGTANTEDLQKMGIEATEFVDRVVTELEKLPAVTTGITNSFENITDQAKNTASAFGDRLVPATSALFDSGSDLLGVLERMPPALKDVSIGVGVATAAMGPLLIAVGGVIRLGGAVTVLGALKTAFFAIGVPAGAAALAIGGVAAAGLALTRSMADAKAAAQEAADSIAAAFANLSPEARIEILEGKRDDAQDRMARLGRSARAAGDTALGRNFAQLALRARNEFVRLNGEIEKLRANLETVAVQADRVFGAIPEIGGLSVTGQAQPLTPPSLVTKGRTYVRGARGVPTTTFVSDRMSQDLLKDIKITLPDLKPLTAAIEDPLNEGGRKFGERLTSVFADIQGTLSGAFSLETIGSNLASNLLSTMIPGAVSMMGTWFSGLFGGESESDKALRENTLAIEKNKEAAEALVGALLATETASAPIAGVAEAFQEAFRRAGDVSIEDSFKGIQAYPVEPFILEELAKLGLSMEDVIAVAKALGIDFESLARDAGELGKALANVSTFGRDFRLLQRQFALFDITDPAEQFSSIMDLLAQSVGDDLAQMLEGLTPENFDAFLEMFRGGFGVLGDLDLGNLNADEFLQALGFAEGALDGLADSADKATEALRNAPSGFKVALERFNASDALTRAPTPVSTGTPGSVAGGIATALAAAGVSSGDTVFHVHGDINLPGVENGKDFLGQLEEEVQWKTRTGAAVIKPTTVR